MTWYDYWFRSPIRELALCHDGIFFALLSFSLFGGTCLFALFLYVGLDLFPLLFQRRPAGRRAHGEKEGGGNHG